MSYEFPQGGAAWWPLWEEAYASLARAGQSFGLGYQVCGEKKYG